MPSTRPQNIAQREEQILHDFISLDPSSFYEKIIELGKKIEIQPKEFFLENERVIGCQSLMLCRVELDKKLRVRIHIFSDALISRGLAAILISILNEQDAKDILLYEPKQLTQLNLEESISIGRVQGFHSLLKTIKKNLLLQLASS